jgi:hypothetical protein
MSLLNGKFLLQSSVTDQPIRLNNNGYLISRNSANTGNINILRVNTSDTIEFATRPIVQGLGLLALTSEISGAQFAKQTYNVLAPLIADTPITLSNTPSANSVIAYLSNGPMLEEGSDYSVSGTTLTLLIASPVIALLDNGDKVIIQYSY